MYIICPGACNHYKHILFRCIYIVIKSIFFASQIYVRSQKVQTVIKCVPYTHFFSKRTLSLNAHSHPVHCHQIYNLTEVHIIIKLLSQKVHIAIQMHAYSLQVYAVIKYTLSASAHCHQMHAHTQQVHIVIKCMHTVSKSTLSSNACTLSASAHCHQMHAHSQQVHTLSKCAHSQCARCHH